MEEGNWDKIHIKNLEVFGKHGVLPEENRLGQKFQINAVLYLSVRKAGLKDDLTKTIHYGDASRFMADFIGSNLGEREQLIRQGIEGLRDLEGCTVEQVSGIITTKPYGVTDQPDFLNGMVALRTLLLPEELLGQLHQIEQEAGRRRSLRWGPRTLDLDIIFYDHAVIDTKELQIPHPDMQNREFVLKPLAEIVPYYRHPLFGKTVQEMLAAHSVKG